MVSDSWVDDVVDKLDAALVVPLRGGEFDHLPQSGGEQPVEGREGDTEAVGLLGRQRVALVFLAPLHDTVVMRPGG